MQPLLLLLAFLLPPRAEAGEIIGGHEAKPHSRPYMALVQFLVKEGRKMCGGALVGEDFVLTAAHCLGSSISVTLGAHNIQKQERTQQVIPVRRAIPHPGYDPNNISNDIMLLEGDSGGPLMCKNVIQGIVSYGRSDGSPPRAYTKVSSFLPWIKKTMKSL
ncbi:granzyme B-like isoform X2 [Diceros bicornis minor]|uniref:granzyme B-like isoform X2 n=1 Tax=Diceros bicornis minor TaxID=77932 RepID=UPI0026F2866C|nr:granzyme B-like isoform X2 [Diceros bicornis minor]XP_058396351.1 granzyme B-like isoform X2 [Diceros bicornis minor]